jgi:hypothetical protein
MMTVCFASLDRFHGCIASCRSAAENLGGTWAVIPSEGPTPRAALEADVLVLSSWCLRYEPLLAEYTGAIVPRWHSPLLQTELCGEGPPLARVVELLDEGCVPALAADDPAMAAVLDRPAVVHLPDLPPRMTTIVQPAQLQGVNVSLFGAAHGRKSLLSQSAAFALSGRRSGFAGWTLHLNGQTTRDANYAEWLALARIPHVDHGWLDRAAYLSLVAAMDVGLCATLSESYGYAAADHIEQGVPVVASPTVACLGAYAPRVAPENVTAIAAALSDCVANRASVTRAQRVAFEDQARTNLMVARRALHDILARVRAHRPDAVRAGGRRPRRFRELRLGGVDH